MAKGGQSDGLHTLHSGWTGSISTPFSFCNKANIRFINVGFSVTHQMESFPETPLVELSLGCWTGTGTGLYWTGITKHCVNFFQRVCSCLRDFLSAGYALLHVLDTVEESKNFWNAVEWRCYDYLPDLEYRVVRVPASRVGYMVPPSELVFLPG
ncbi:hypothetical protein QC764_103030 [Podospora pseudoanserina]|uniref:Uncharacterized protein n=1 Tax=Podospora pseudoanserina TaxID=2609844 RepID=A0ABR0IL89_9PEZI|nr:hypothetical protein QC764_103030 [Podospora pseudoanserina]